MRYIIFAIKLILVIPHLIVYQLSNSVTKSLIEEDLAEMNRRCKKRGRLSYYLITKKPYRNLFYFRIGENGIVGFLKILLPPYNMFYISENVESIGGGAFVLNHPYGTIINAKSIGKNLTICQLTTIGNKAHGRNDLLPKIGNNVSIGANVNIIGDIEIGDNVIVGAGSTVVKNIPDNSIVAGCPARVIACVD